MGGAAAGEDGRWGAYVAVGRRRRRAVPRQQEEEHEDAGASALRECPPTERYHSLGVHARLWRQARLASPLASCRREADGQEVAVPSSSLCTGPGREPEVMLTGCFGVDSKTEHSPDHSWHWGFSYWTFSCSQII